MAVWDEGCERLARLLLEHLRCYSADVCSEAVGKDQEETYVRRLWTCLSHHWCDAIKIFGCSKTTSAHVSGRIQKGKGYQRGGKLGGNPLRDIVLAVAMVSKDERAIAVFTEDYRGFAVGLAYRIDKRLVGDPDEWWFDLLAHLAGYSESKPRFDRFFGRCALQNWLGTVIWNFLRRHWLPDGEPEEPPEPPDHSLLPLDDESLCLFDEIVRSALAAFCKMDRLLLALVYVDTLDQADAASAVGISAGHASRRLKRARRDLKKTTKRMAKDRFSEDAVEGIFRELDHNPRAFGEILRRAIDENREHDEPEEGEDRKEAS